MSWSDTTPAPNVKAAAMLPPGDSSVCAEAGSPTMAATNKCLAQRNKSHTRGEATKERIRQRTGYPTIRLDVA
jgi:hypothetical protein